MTNYRRRKRAKRVKEKRYVVNGRIKADEVRLVDEEGGMIGVLSFDEAAKLAEDKEMDLVEINPKADPPVVKLIDYNKFKYQMSKSGADKQKKKTEKTLRVSVRVSENDLAVRAKKAQDFLEKGIKVKLQVQMRGREKAYPEVAKEVMEKFLSFIEGEYELENDIKLTGDSYFAFLKPKK